MMLPSFLPNLPPSYPRIFGRKHNFGYNLDDGGGGRGGSTICGGCFWALHQKRERGTFKGCEDEGNSVKVFITLLPLPSHLWGPFDVQMHLWHLPFDFVSRFSSERESWNSPHLLRKCKQVNTVQSRPTIKSLLEASSYNTWIGIPVYPYYNPTKTIDANFGTTIKSVDWATKKCPSWLISTGWANILEPNVGFIIN